MPRRAAALAAGAALLGCGARTAIQGDDAASGGGGSSDFTSSVAADGATSGDATAPSSTAGQGTSSSAATGSGGGAAGCTSLAWAGEPIFVASASTPSARHPHLTALDDETVALVFEEVGGGSTLVSVALDAWAPWPIGVSRIQPNYPVGLDGSPVAVAAGPGHFAFASSDGASRIALGTAEPAQNGSTVAVLDGLPGPARWLTSIGAPGDARLLGHGAENFLVVDRVATSSLTATSLGTFGCAEGPLVSEAVAFAGGFLVASSNNDPFDDCLDPDIPGPARLLQTMVVRDDGGVSQGSYVEVDGVVEDVVVAARAPGGAWLGRRTVGDDVAWIHPVAGDGTFGDAGLQYGLYPDDRFTLLGWGEGLAVVTAGVVPEASLGLVLVMLMDAEFGYVAHTVESPITSLAPAGRPAVVAGPDQRSFLVAVEQVDAAGSTVALLRADCAP